MKSFVEFLVDRDPYLLQEYIELSEANWAKYGIPLAMAAAGGAAQAGTPTELQQRQAYNKLLAGRPQDAKSQEELEKMLWAKGLTIDQFLKQIEPNPNKIDATTKLYNADLDTTKLRKNTPTEHEDNYTPNEILFKKVVNPHDLIRMGQTNKDKFDLDFATLPNDNPNDKGFATFKTRFNSPVLLYVVDDKAMNRVVPGAAAYNIATENPDTKEIIETIFLRKSAFKRLPSGNDLGELTKDGWESTVHELRHGTQHKQNVDPDKRGAGIGTSRFDYDDYMHIPLEMGVRLAATKNLMSPQTILDATKDNNFHSKIANIILQKTRGNEKELMKTIMNAEGPYKLTLDYIKNKIKAMDGDVTSLFDFYDSLAPNRKATFMQQLIDNYDTVVKNQVRQPANL